VDHLFIDMYYRAQDCRHGVQTGEEGMFGATKPGDCGKPLVRLVAQDDGEQQLATPSAQFLARRFPDEFPVLRETDPVSGARSALPKSLNKARRSALRFCALQDCYL